MPTKLFALSKRTMETHTFFSNPTRTKVNNTSSATNTESYLNKAKIRKNADVYGSTIVTDKSPKRDSTRVQSP